MKYLYLLPTLIFLSGCAMSYLTIKENSDGTTTIKRPIQNIAVGEPGINGARNFLTSDAYTLCPSGWVTHYEKVEETEKDDFLIWNISCHN